MSKEKALLIKRPYTVVDATVSYHLSGIAEQYPDVIQRWQPRSAGSSLHRIDAKPREGNAVTLFAIEVRAAALEQTVVTVFAGEALQNYQHSETVLVELILQIEHEADRFNDWAATLDEARPRPAKGDLQISIRQATEDIIKSLIPKPKPRGSHGTDDNNWARAQLASGRDEIEVRAEYLQRQNVDLSDEIAVAQAFERFRKATKRPGRK